LPTYKTVDLGCYASSHTGAEISIYVDDFRAWDEVRTVYTLRVLHPHLGQESTLKMDPAPNDFEINRDPATGREEMGLSYFCRNGIAYLEIDRSRFRLKRGVDSSRVQVSFMSPKTSEGGLLLKISVRRLQLKPVSERVVVSFDFGNDATKCARHNRNNKHHPASDKVLEGTDKVLPSRLYALAFCRDVERLKYWDNSITYVTEKQYRDFVEAYKGKWEKQSGDVYVPAGAWTEIKGKDGRPVKDDDGRPVRELTLSRDDVRVVASGPLEGFKAKLGTPDSLVERQEVSFPFKNVSYPVSLKLTEDEGQNPILCYFTRVLRSAMQFDRFIYSLPGIKTRARVGGGDQDGCLTYAAALEMAANLVSPCLRCDHDHARYYEEGLSAAAFYAQSRYYGGKKWSDDISYNEIGQEQLVVIEMGAGHTHLIKCKIDKNHEPGRPAVQFLDDPEVLAEAGAEAKIEDFVKGGSLVVAGEFITMGPFYHFLINDQLLTEVGGRPYDPHDPQDLRERAEWLDVVFHELERFKLNPDRIARFSDKLVGAKRVYRFFSKERTEKRLGLETLPEADWARRYSVEFSRALLQLFRALFFSGIPTYRGIADYAGKLGADGAGQTSRKTFDRCLAMGFRHTLSHYEEEFQKRIYDEGKATEVVEGDDYRDFLCNYCFVDAYPESTRPDPSSDVPPPSFADRLGIPPEHMTSVQCILRDFAQEYADAVSDGKPPVLTIQFSGRASGAEGLTKYARLLVRDVIRNDEVIRRACPDLDELERHVKVEDRDIEKARQAVSHGNLFRFSDLREKPEDQRLFDLPGV